MKRFSLILAALALVLGTSQCSKEDNPMQGGGRQHIVLNASFDDDGNSKIADDNIGGLKWSVNDQIDVFQNNAKIGFLKCTDADNGVFSGDIDLTTDDLTFTYGKEIGDGYYMEQSGELKDVIYLTASAPYNAKGDYDVKMKNMPHAVLRLDLSAFAGDENVTISVGTTEAASVASSAISDAVYVAIKVDDDNNEAKEYFFSGNGKSASKKWTLANDCFYTKAGEGNMPTGESIVITSQHEYVDLGLPSGLLWATCNVGAENPEEYGDYFQWGGTTSVTSTSINVGWAICPFNNGSSNYDATYFVSVKDEVCPDLFLALQYDAARANWGGDWRMPTHGEWRELNDNTTRELTIHNGVYGLKFTSKFDDTKFVFLPAAGLRKGRDLNSTSSDGYYWSKHLYSSYLNNAHRIHFNSGTVDIQGNNGRYHGFSVRPIRQSQK